MIVYTYLKLDNKILSIIPEVIQITGEDVLGKSGSAKGIDTDLVGIMCLDTDTELVKTVESVEMPLEEGDVLDIASLTNVKRKFEIFYRLEELDKVIARDTEQLYVDSSLTPSYSVMADAIAEKITLRTELATL